MNKISLVIAVVVGMSASSVYALNAEKYVKDASKSCSPCLGGYLCCDYGTWACNGCAAKDTGWSYGSGQWNCSCSKAGGSSGGQPGLVRGTLPNVSTSRGALPASATKNTLAPLKKQ